MVRKPWVVKVIASALTLVPFISLGIFYQSQTIAAEHLSVEIQICMWALSISSLVVAFGVWKVRRWGFFTFLLFIAAALTLDIYQILNDPQTVNIWDFVDFALAIAGTIFITHKNVRRPYFNPNIRWWERPTRHKTDLQVTIKSRDKILSCVLLDVSESGCFIEREESLNFGETADFKFQFDELNYRSQVRVARKSTNPKGLGLMFINTDSTNRKIMKRIIKQLKQSANEPLPKRSIKNSA